LYLFERAHGRREWIDRKRVEGAPPVVMHQRMHDQLMHGHVRAVEGGELLGDLAESHRVKAFAIDLALDLDAPALREVFDGPVVYDVAPAAHRLGLLRRL